MKILYIFLIGLFLLLFYIWQANIFFHDTKEKQSFSLNTFRSSPTLSQAPQKTHIFQGLSDVIEEAGSPESRKNSDFWLSSGGRFIIDGNTAMTLQNELKSGDPWKKQYAESNPLDTDNGTKPQNIFRLVYMKKCLNCTQVIYVKINKINKSKSSNRNESNGILLFNRYIDSDNLYYAGIRVDGYATIKKKLAGEYETLALKKIFFGAPYDRNKNPNLIPEGKWIGIKSSVRNITKNAVQLQLFFDEEGDGTWEEVFSVVDKSVNGDNRFLQSQLNGIRTDFMDAAFQDFQLIEKD